MSLYDRATDTLIQEPSRIRHDPSVTPKNCSAISMNIHTLNGMIDDNSSITIHTEGVKDLFKDIAACINDPANCMQYTLDNSAIEGGKKSKRTRNSKNKNKNKTKNKNKNYKRANKKKKTIKSKSKRRPLSRKY